MKAAIAVASFLIAVPMPASAQSADPYRWCALYTGNGLGGASNCYFVTQEQCLATISGVGGSCMPNPRNLPAQFPSRPQSRSR